MVLETAGSGCPMSTQRLFFRGTAANGSAVYPQTSVFSVQPCLSECIAPGSETQCSWPTTDPNTNVTFLLGNVATCYCINELKTSVKGLVSRRRQQQWRP